MISANGTEAPGVHLSGYEASTQCGFAFDAPLNHTPAMTIAKAERGDDAELAERLAAILPLLPDVVTLTDPLVELGFSVGSLTTWHRCGSMRALVGGIPPEFQAFLDGAILRFRRLPPFEVCPGMDDETCTTLTRGGVRCARHLRMEQEYLFNHA